VKSGRRERRGRQSRGVEMGMETGMGNDIGRRKDIERMASIVFPLLLAVVVICFRGIVDIGDVIANVADILSMVLRTEGRSFEGRRFGWMSVWRIRCSIPDVVAVTIVLLIFFIFHWNGCRRRRS